MLKLYQSLVGIDDYKYRLKKIITCLDWRCLQIKQL